MELGGETSKITVTWDVPFPLMTSAHAHKKLYVCLSVKDQMICNYFNFNYFEGYVR